MLRGVSCGDTFAGDAFKAAQSRAFVWALSRPATAAAPSEMELGCRGGWLGINNYTDERSPAWSGIRQIPYSCGFTATGGGA